MAPVLEPKELQTPEVATSTDTPTFPQTFQGYSFTTLEATHGGIDGEEFMGSGTSFTTDEHGPVYTPPR